MRLLFIRILLRLLSDKSYKQTVKTKEIEEWLISLSASDSGYRGYYTIRKKAILDIVALGLEQKEYWTYQGRLLELKHLNQLSSDLNKKYSKKPKKK